MKHDQLPLPIDARMYHRQWRALGYAILICPGCRSAVSYPANTRMYAVVCKCGWFTSLDEKNQIFWHPPETIREAIQEKFFEANKNN